MEIKFRGKNVKTGQWAYGYYMDEDYINLQDYCRGGQQDSVVCGQKVK
jgi:hypothetical protein